MAKYEAMRKMRRIRRAADMTQRELAEKVGCSTNTIGGYEIGACSPSISMLKKLAAALNCEVGDLI